MEEDEHQVEEDEHQVDLINITVRNSYLHIPEQ